MTSKLLRCLNKNCDATPLGMSVAGARAILDAQLTDNPSPELRLLCQRCGGVSVYARDLVLQLLPPDLQDLTLAPFEFWAFIMLPVGTVESTRHRAFVGEAVLLKRIDQTRDGWQATLLSPSKFAPTLKVGEEIIGFRDGRFDICSHVWRDGAWTPLPLTDAMPRQSDFALFFLPDDPNSHFLTATLFCVNPSCYYPFQTTHTEWAARSARLRSETAALGGSLGLSTLECPRCGAHRVVTEQSFEGMVKT